MSAPTPAAVERAILLALRAIAPRGRRDTAVIAHAAQEAAPTDVAAAMRRLEAAGLIATEVRHERRWTAITVAGVAQVTAWDTEARAYDAAAAEAALDAELAAGLAP